MLPQRIVLLAHGSPTPGWQTPFLQIAKNLSARLGAEYVRLAYLEFVRPDLAEVANEAVLQKHRTLRVLPVFLGSGKHVNHDIPRRVAEARQRFPELQIELLPSIGEDPRLLALIETLAHESALSGRAERRA